MDALSGLPFVPGLNLGPQKKAIHGLFIPYIPVYIDAEAAAQARPSQSTSRKWRHAGARRQAWPCSRGCPGPAG